MPAMAEANGLHHPELPLRLAVVDGAEGDRGRDAGKEEEGHGCRALLGVAASEGVCPIAEVVGDEAAANVPAEAAAEAARELEFRTDGVGVVNFWAMLSNFLRLCHRRW